MEAIGDAKGLNISLLDVREMTDITDYMIIVTGSSNRHVKSIMKTVVAQLRDQGCRPVGIEGELYGQWILLDFSDALVHVMVADVREFYDLENLWKSTLRPPASVASESSD